MAHFEILKEVRHPDPNDTTNPASKSKDRQLDWQICFQYGIYQYDPEPNTTTPVFRETGYRFIWRRPNGNLQGARGQARLLPEWITILLGKAALNGWYPNPPVTGVTQAKPLATP